MSTRGPVAVVTGAGSGIGRAVSAGLSRAGYRVVRAGRDRGRLERTDLPSPHLDVPTDVRDVSSVRALFAATRDAFGRCDLLFNNAGIGTRAAGIDELEIEEWRNVVDTNLTGAFLCTREAFALMKSQVPRGGRIINNGSLAAHAPRPLSAAYTASKHAITGLTKSTSLEGRAYDIACGQIDIGNAATDMTAPMESGALQPRGDRLPEPRFDVLHVSRAVVYMASLPLDANVQFMTVMATKMPFIGRG